MPGRQGDTPIQQVLQLLKQKKYNIFANGGMHFTQVTPTHCVHGSRAHPRAWDYLSQGDNPIFANIEYAYRGEDALAEIRKCFQYCKDALAE